MADPRYPAAFFGVTDGQLATLSVPGLESITKIQREIVESSQFRLVFESPDAQIYTLASREPGASS
jgi:hypothetical protein